VLSDPSSVCLNTTSISPYDPLITFDDETNCNSCICLNGKPRCSNLWCGLPNCLKKNKTNSGCELHEVCVPASQETCLVPPCQTRGDCRSLEPSRRVAPPSLPAPIECWPNQAVLDEQCSRISILLELSQLPKGATVETVCHSLRMLLGGRLIQNSKNLLNTLLVLLCDLKNGTNDTIEVTISAPTKEKVETTAIKEAVRLLEDLLSRQSSILGNAFLLEHPEAKPLVAILEVKVETATTRDDHTSSGFILVTILCVVLAILCLGAFIALMWRQRKSTFSGSGVNLTPPVDVSRHEEEKSNNLQNEENFRRYANPIKGSATSLRGAMELSLNPAPEVTHLSNLAGPSVLHRSQPLYPSPEVEYDKDVDGHKTPHRNSQHLLYKTQNTDMTKNTVGSIECPHKDFDKRSIHTSMTAPVGPTVTPAVVATPAAAVESDVLTVHV
jgi:jagged-1